MSLPRFFSRVADSAVPILGGIDPAGLAARLEDTMVVLGGTGRPAERPGYLLAANLLARLYPVIGLDAPHDLVAEAADTIRAINPEAEIRAGSNVHAVSLWIGADGPGPSAREVTVQASGWAIALDSPDRYDAEPTAPAILAAACVGVGEVFRTVFAAELGARGRTAPAAGILNLITLNAEIDLPPFITGTNVGRVTLVGAGAIGQAALLTLGSANACGGIRIVDPEAIELSNLQRYVLTSDGQVGQSKVALAARFLEGTGLAVSRYQEPWSADLADPVPGGRTLVALDSAEDRIAVQSGLPGDLYNAWTQPRDLGWSRHEHFGNDPCLACLYWPTQPRLNRHELLAEALGEHPLRILAYLTINAPVGWPLAPQLIPRTPALPPPPDAPRWASAALIDDVAARFGLNDGQLERWRDAPLDRLYRDAVCGEAMLDFSLAGIPQQAVVPLAHQSALAGVLLAVQLLAASNPELRPFRPAAIEGRLDVLAPWPQLVARPRRPTANCLCSDTDFRAAAREHTVQS